MCLERWLSRLTISDAVGMFGVSWNTVCEIDRRRLKKLAGPKLAGLKRLAIDENYLGKSHKFITVVLDLDTRAIVSVTKGRTEASLRSGLSGLGTAVCSGVQFVCSDKWKPYLKVTGEQLSTAVPVLDRFHIMQKFGKALDEIRAEESKPLPRDEYEP